MRATLVVIASLALLATLFSCVTPGAQVKYESPTLSTKPSSIGIIIPFKDIKYMPQYLQVFPAAKKVLSEIPGVSVKELGRSGELSFKSPDIEKIKVICEQENLDSIVLIDQHMVVDVQENTGALVNDTIDSVAECKFFYKDGTLLVHSSFNTRRNMSYKKRPSFEQATFDSVEGVLRAIINKYYASTP